MQKLSNTLFCAVICILMFAGVQPVYGEKTPEEILHEAMQFFSHVSFSADSCNDDGRVSQKRYTKVNPDGSRWTRLQGLEDDGMYTIMKDDGTYRPPSSAIPLSTASSPETGPAPRVLINFILSPAVCYWCGYAARRRDARGKRTLGSRPPLRKGRLPPCRHRNRPFASALDMFTDIWPRIRAALLWRSCT